MLKAKYQILTFKRQRTDGKRLTPVHSKKRQVLHGMCLQGHISQVNAVENTPSGSGQAPQPPSKGFCRDSTAVPRPFLVHPMLVCSSWCMPFLCVLPGLPHARVPFQVNPMLVCPSWCTPCPCAVPSFQIHSQDSVQHQTAQLQVAPSVGGLQVVQLCLQEMQPPLAPSEPS